MDHPLIPSYDFAIGDDLAIPFRYLPLERSEGTYDASEPHRHNYFEIFYFIIGGGEHDIDFRTFPIRDASIHFVIPGQVHRLRRDADAHGHIVLFTADFYSLGLRNREVLLEIPFLEHVSSFPVLAPEPTERASIEGMFALMREEFSSGASHREVLLRSYLNVLLVHARRTYERVAPEAAAHDADHLLVNRLRGLIERRFSSVRSPAAYAAELNVSQNHLNSIVQHMLGRTTTALIHERIVLEAKRLLFHSDASVKEVAFHLGFDDASYFTRFFRRHVGSTPQEFRDAGERFHHSHESSYKRNDRRI